MRFLAGPTGHTLVTIHVGIALGPVLIDAEGNDINGDATNPGFVGKFHNQQKVDNSFLRQTLAFRHRPLCRSLDSRLWLNRLSPRVRSFLTAM